MEDLASKGAGEEGDAADEKKIVDKALEACKIKEDAKLLLLTLSTADGEQSTLFSVRSLLMALAKEIRSMPGPESKRLSNGQNLEVDEKINQAKTDIADKIGYLESLIGTEPVTPPAGPPIVDPVSPDHAAIADQAHKATKSLRQTVDELTTTCTDCLDRLEDLETGQTKLDSLPHGTDLDADLQVLYEAALDNRFDGRDSWPFAIGDIQAPADRRDKVSTAMSGPWIKRQALQEKILRIDEQCGVLGSHGPRIGEINVQLSAVENDLRQQLDRTRQVIQQQKDTVEKLQDDTGKLQEDFEEERIFRDDQHQRGMRRDKEAADQLRSLMSRIKPLIEQDLGRVEKDWQAELTALRDEVQKALDVVDDKVGWLQQKLQSNFWMVGQMM
mmetsp:Transcript_46461/g.108204  ORF Transcript_46461/g.108204 Transcript_46461/m.108204 type:complete len:387 (-) Transcript_46461:132-1292(-)